MPDPTRPKAWANLLSQLWGPRFPVGVETIALDYSLKKFSDPIKTIAKADIDQFEGALAPLRKKGGWAILYNPRITSPGRMNFTLAHEFGHYLVHRKLNPAGFECGEKHVLGIDLDAKRRQIEQEADEFASYLLMPLNDYRAQVGCEEMTLDLLRHCADRYGVSLTAAAIKWLRFHREVRRARGRDERLRAVVLAKRGGEKASHLFREGNGTAVRLARLPAGIDPC